MTTPATISTDATPIPLLQRISNEGKTWGVLAEKYGVDNPNPPWKINVDGICDALNADACALPAVERRNEEDELAESLYRHLPQPERQLVALAHTMIRRGLVDEGQLAKRIEEVRRRLTE